MLSNNLTTVVLVVLSPNEVMCFFVLTKDININPTNNAASVLKASKFYRIELLIENLSISYKLFIISRSFIDSYRISENFDQSAWF